MATRADLLASGRTALSLLLLVAGPTSAGAAESAPGGTSDDIEPLESTPGVLPVIGGNETAVCGWPTVVHVPTVAVGTCTGTLVHPQVVVFAAHCGTKMKEALRMGEKRDGSGGGRMLEPEFCKVNTAHTLGDGADWGFCKLKAPVTDVPVIPPLMGCEMDALKPGVEVTVVGFGYDEKMKIGVKRELVTTLAKISSKPEAVIGKAGETLCNGDSGGPAFVRLGDGTLRQFGINSWGYQCQREAYFTLLHRGVPWIEKESGIDITPCHDADGSWNAGPDCRGFATDPGPGGGTWDAGCMTGPVSDWGATCGAPHAGGGGGSGGGGAGGGSGGGGAGGGGSGGGGTGGGGSGGGGNGGGAGSGGGTGGAGEDPPPRNTVGGGCSFGGAGSSHAVGLLLAGLLGLGSRRPRRGGRGTMRRSGP